MTAMSTRPRHPAPRLDVDGSGWSSHQARENPAGSDRGTTGGSVPKLPIGVREGEVLAEKYRIGETIGAGAMGVVVAARHLRLDQKVAIKFLVPRAQEHPSSIARFMREARATARIKSEHVVRVLDVDVLDGGVPYIVMEFLEGCDLAEWLRRRGSLPAEQACDVILQACDAVQEAHGLDIIHRDIKPPNLFVVHQAGMVQTIKVLDFGISKMTEVTPATIDPDEWKERSVVTEDRATIGSPHYMSPEQMESARDVDARTDVWALGVTLYELITGRLPFEGASFLQVYSGSPRRRLEHLRASLANHAARARRRDPQVPGAQSREAFCQRERARDGPRGIAGSDRADVRRADRALGTPGGRRSFRRNAEPPGAPAARSRQDPPLAHRPLAGGAGEEPKASRARRRVVLGTKGIAVVAFALWASASWRAPSDGRGRFKSGAQTSSRGVATGLESVAEPPRPTVVDASSPAAIASISAAPVVAPPKRVDVRLPPPAPPLLGSTKAHARRAPAANAPPETAPSTRTKLARNERRRVGSPGRAEVTP